VIEHNRVCDRDKFAIVTKSRRLCQPIEIWKVWQCCLEFLGCGV
jgi:hypothetical protein